jgi:hypothetical protein
MVRIVPDFESLESQAGDSCEVAAVDASPEKLIHYSQPLRSNARSGRAIKHAFDRVEIFSGGGKAVIDRPTLLFGAMEIPQPRG